MNIVDIVECENFKNNFLSIKLLKDIKSITNEEIEKSVDIISTKIENLDNKKDIYINLLNTMTLTHWFFYIGLIHYLEKDLYIKSSEFRNSDKINYFVNELITAEDLKKRIHISYFDSEEKE